VVEADAGAGKTRLLDEAAARAARGGMRVLVARGTALERPAPHGVVRQLLDPVLAADTARDRAARLSGPAAPAAVALGLGDPVDDPTFAVRHGLVALTAGLAAGQPLALVVDDAHWADAPSLRYLLLVAARLATLPVLLIVGHRPAAADDRHHLRRLASSPGVEPLMIGPLGPSAVASLLADALDGPPAAGLADAVARATGGNPFLVVETARAIVARSAEPVADQRAFVGDQVPPAVGRSVVLRLAEQGEEAARVARATAILGDGTPMRIVAAFTGLGTDALGAAADRLRAAAILDPGARLAFLHPLIRSAVTQDLAPGARDEAHRRAAALLTADGAAAGAVARHLLRTSPGRDAPVAELLSRAAREALVQGAPDAAVLFVRRALEETADSVRRAELHELLLAATVDAADADGLAPLGDDPLFDELVETIMADPERLRRRAAGLTTWLAGTGRLAEATGLTDRAARDGVRRGDVQGAVEMEAQLIVLGQLPPAAGLERLERYRDHLAPGSREARLIAGLDAWWAGLLGRPASEAMPLARIALDGNRSLEDDLCAAPLQLSTLVLARADDLDGAGATAEAIVASADRRGSVAAQVTGRYLRAFVAHRGGALADAERDAREAIDRARMRGLLLVIPLMSALLAQVLVDRDALADAERVLDEGVGRGAPPGGYWFGPVRFARARLLLAQGRVAPAVAELRALAGQQEEWGIAGYAGTAVGTLLARAALVDGERPAARAAASEELARARRWGAGSVVAEAMTGSGAAEGGEEGERLLREAVALAARSPARLVHAAALVERGVLRRWLRRARDSREPLRAGLELARRCGATRLARRAADELEAGGARPVRHGAIGPGALTATERRVAELAAAGMTNREIAAARVVSVKTVESHLRAAYDKLGIATRGELPGALTAG